MTRRYCAGGGVGGADVVSDEFGWSGASRRGLA